MTTKAPLRGPRFAPERRDLKDYSAFFSVLGQQALLACAAQRDHALEEGRGLRFIFGGTLHRDGGELFSLSCLVENGQTVFFFPSGDFAAERKPARKERKQLAVDAVDRGSVILQLHHKTTLPVLSRVQ